MEKLVAGAKRLGLCLSPLQITQFETYYRELVEANKKVNLTAITDYEGVQVKHFLDSLTVALVLPPAPASLLDVGSGAGLPGVALKILLPHLHLTLLESVAKKTAFLRHLLSELNLEAKVIT